MKATQLTILGILAIVTGCGINPCNVSTLFANMTAEQQASCQQCGNANGCDDSGETGGDDSPPETLRVSTADQLIEPAPSGQIGYVLPLTATTSHPATDTYSIDADDCPFLSTPVPCERSWVTPWQGEQECSICNLTHYNADATPEPDHPVGGPGSWGVCLNLNTPGGKYTPALVLDPLEETPTPLPNWLGQAQCDDGVGGSYEPIHYCSMIHLSSSISTDIETGLWTCSCDDDTDCPSGSVCEAGWTVNGGGIPQPTLCTWDDGSGTSNGAAPEGPEVYGLAQWSDGIDISSTGVVTVTAPFLTAAVAGGAWNDDQQFTEFGEITHCGPDALCALFGLVANDVVDFDPEDIDPLLKGDPVPVSILDATGGLKSSWTLVLAD